MTQLQALEKIKYLIDIDYLKFINTYVGDVLIINKDYTSKLKYVTSFSDYIINKEEDYIEHLKRTLVNEGYLERLDCNNETYFLFTNESMIEAINAYNNYLIQLKEIKEKEKVAKLELNTYNKYVYRLLLNSKYGSGAFYS